MKPRKTTFDPRRIAAGAPLVGAAIDHLEQLVGPQPLRDSRVRACLKVPTPRDRERKVDALQGRLERLGIGVLDRYCREVHGMTWQRVSGFIKIGTAGAVVPTERQLEHAHTRLMEVEAAVGYEHPEPRQINRRPRLDRASVRFRDAGERIERSRGSASAPPAALAELCRAQADLYALAGGDRTEVELSPVQLRRLAAELESTGRSPVKSYTLSREELERRLRSSWRTS